MLKSGTEGSIWLLSQLYSIFLDRCRSTVSRLVLELYKRYRRSSLDVGSADVPIDFSCEGVAVRTREVVYSQYLSPFFMDLLHLRVFCAFELFQRHLPVLLALDVEVSQSPDRVAEEGSEFELAVLGRDDYGVYGTVVCFNLEDVLLRNLQLSPPQESLAVE